MLRRIAVMAAALMALSVSAYASEYLCLVSPEITALVDEAGNALIEGADIGDVFVVREGALYAAGTKGDYGLYDVEGNALGETRFAMVDDQDDCLVYRSGGLFGAMDAAGEVRLEARWTQLACDGEGGWLALNTDPLDDRPDEIFHIDTDGVANPTGVYTACGLSRVFEGRMPYMSVDGLYGAVDARGETIIAPQWRYVGAFEGGVAKATGSGGVGLIDREGAIVISPSYRWLERGNGMLVACSDAGVEVYSADGSSHLFAIEGEKLEAAVVGNCLAVADGNAVRLYDSRGTLVSESGPETTYAPGTKGQVIASDGEWGEVCQWLIDPDGSAASGRFQRLLPLCEGRYAFLAMEGVEYYSDDLGRLQKSWNYESARWGLMDDAGRLMLPARYTEIRALSGDRLLLRDENGARLTDADGTVIRLWPVAAGEGPTAEAGA